MGNQNLKKIGIFVLIFVLSFLFINLLGQMEIMSCKSSCNPNPNLKCPLGGKIDIKCEITYFENNFLDKYYFMSYTFILPIITSLIVFFGGDWIIKKVKQRKK